MKKPRIYSNKWIQDIQKRYTCKVKLIKDKRGRVALMEIKKSDIEFTIAPPNADISRIGWLIN